MGRWFLNALHDEMRYRKIEKGTVREKVTRSLKGFVAFRYFLRIRKP